MCGNIIADLVLPSTNENVSYNWVYPVLFLVSETRSARRRKSLKNKYLARNPTFWTWVHDFFLKLKQKVSNKTLSKNNWNRRYLHHATLVLAGGLSYSRNWVRQQEPVLYGEDTSISNYFFQETSIGSVCLRITKKNMYSSPFSLISS